MATESDDARVWERALLLDPRAFGELFERHHRRVFRHALRLLLVPADADEVMAAAFFELWRRRTNVRVVEGSVLPWLLVTATNLCRNRMRGVRRYQATLARLPAPAQDDPAELAAVRIDRQAQRRRILTALREVSAVDAALITLTVIDGLSPSEAAAAVGLSPGAARTRLSRARGRLRTLLADLQPDAEFEALKEIRP